MQFLHTAITVRAVSETWFNDQRSVLPMSALESRVFTLFSRLMIPKFIEGDNKEIEEVNFYRNITSSHKTLPHVVA
jgi:hypothetical protein